MCLRFRNTSSQMLKSVHSDQFGYKVYHGSKGGWVHLFYIIWYYILWYHILSLRFIADRWSPLLSLYWSVIHSINLNSYIISPYSYILLTSPYSYILYYFSIFLYYISPYSYILLISPYFYIIFLHILIFYFSIFLYFISL